MVHIDKTVINTIDKSIKEISLQAKDNSRTNELLMSLIILQDLIRWSGNLEQKAQLVDMMVKYRNAIIARNPNCFKTHIIHSDDYTNVNIPDTEELWSRLTGEKNYKIVLPDTCCELEELTLGHLITEGQCVIPSNCVDLEIIDLECSKYE